MKTWLAGWVPLLVLVLASGCKTPGPTQPSASDGRLPNLGRHTLRVTTGSVEAQRAFDRGLTLAYAFSHRAAEEEFRRAAAADPELAMAWWGIALVNGPHINFPAVPPESARKAWDALNRATVLSAHASALEQDLIRALGKRYADPQPEDRSALDQAYAEALREVWHSHRRNADVGTLFAEALMDLHPWDLWDLSGAAKPWTPEIVSTLEQTLSLNRRHPGANHLYIHAVEASGQPGKALAAADRLGSLVPDASHLVHMPSHIYARTGRWKAAADSNQRAMQADVIYRRVFPQPGFYAMYMAHNTHFLAFTAMMRGRSQEALRMARSMVAEVPADFLRDFAPVVDGYMIFPSAALMRFGRWEEILAERLPPSGLPLSLALWHFTRAVALTALDRPGDARREQAAFVEATAAVPGEWAFGNNPAAAILAVAARVLDGEMAAKAGRFDEAIASLREGVRLEDELRYDEPPDWIQPVRHTLGAVLMHAGRPAEAEMVYRADLVNFPGNGWSLYGLGRALHRQGRHSAARVVEKQFGQAWVGADIQLNSTCLCQPGM